MATLNIIERWTLREQIAYDPWGKRRQTNGLTDVLDSVVGYNTDRGFTLHEHLEGLGAVHMNGRIYDPLIGRFMSADILVQDPYNLQSFNRYSYVLNNPLAFTDPTGWCSHYLPDTSEYASCMSDYVPTMPQVEVPGKYDPYPEMTFFDWAPTPSQPFSAPRIPGGVPGFMLTPPLAIFPPAMLPLAEKSAKELATKAWGLVKESLDLTQKLLKKLLQKSPVPTAKVLLIMMSEGENSKTQLKKPEGIPED